MRVRKKKHGAERLAACENYFFPACENISEVFENGNPVHVEIGCGKGTFVRDMAKKYPEINFIAVEKITDVMVCCAEKIKSEELSNVRVLCADAKTLAEAIPANSVDRIYLNFSDPWPKAGHKKRRLTHKIFLDVYKQILKKDGSIALKTDNDSLFEFSLEEFAANGFTLDEVSYDLHSSDFAKENVMTEYEANFSKQGIPIKRCVAKL
jgi:tRNA (guanine-N7-)-methyltransferase